MNWLSIFRIKIIVLTFLLSSLNFGRDDKSNINDSLINAVKETNFAKFKILYPESALSMEQQNELLNMINGIIEAESKSWWASKCSIRASVIKEEIKICRIAIPILTLSAALAIGVFSYQFWKKQKDWKIAFDNLQNQTTPIPFRSTAARQGKNLELLKSYGICQAKMNFIMYCIPAFYGFAAFMALKLNQAVLLSYKRWKKAWKMKKMIEPMALMPFVPKNIKAIKL